METANRLELHYFLTNDTHDFDAFVRNRCESELLLIAKDIMTSLNLNIEIISEIPTEGGFTEFWKFLEKNKAEIAVGISAISLIVQIINGIMARVPVTNPLQDKQEQVLNLDIEERKLRIEALKKDKVNDQDSEKLLEEAIDFFNTNIKTIKHKSNFYQTLQNYLNVTKISTQAYEDITPKGQPNVVERNNFSKFVLTTNELPEQTVENAIIEIIAPVLKNGKYKWKGVYEGDTIDFSMEDIEYKKSVVKKEITFESGFYIEALLKVRKVIDDFGIIQNRGYRVVTVLGRVVDNKVIETEQGKRYRRIKADLKKQTKMDI